MPGARMVTRVVDVLAIALLSFSVAAGARLHGFIGFREPVSGVLVTRQQVPVLSTGCRQSLATFLRYEEEVNVGAPSQLLDRTLVLEVRRNQSVLLESHAEKALQLWQSKAGNDAGDPSWYSQWHLKQICGDSFAHCVDVSKDVSLFRLCMAQCKKDVSELQYFDAAWVAAVLSEIGHLDSVLEFGSGRGDFLLELWKHGVPHLVGVQPGYMGDFAYYSPGWEFESGPIQLPIFLPQHVSVLNLAECCMFGADSHKYDLVQSLEVLEHIPRKDHCSIINMLTSRTARWVVLTVARIGQHGDAHIANRHQEDLRGEFTSRGFTYRKDIVDRILTKCGQFKCTLAYLRDNLQVFEVAGTVTPIDCETEHPGAWAPYEDWDAKTIYLPDGSTLQSGALGDKWNDWPYITSLSKGKA